METEPLNLATCGEQTIRNLADLGYLARRMGALPGNPPNEFWALTFNGEQLFHLI